jgi:hypothetical protein
VRTNQVVFEIPFSQPVTCAQTNNFPMTLVNCRKALAVVSALDGGRTVYQETADIF